MLDKLMELISRFLEEILPWVVINEFSAGVVLRLGKFHKEVKPGFYWKIPFADRVYEDVVIMTTMELPSQTLTTRDAKQVVVKSIVKYEISDVKLFVLSIYDAKDAISDLTQGIIKKMIATMDWDKCNDNELDNIITKKVRTELKRFGVSADSVTLTNVGLVRSIRLFNEKDPEHKVT